MLSETVRSHFTLVSTDTQIFKTHNDVLKRDSSYIETAWQKLVKVIQAINER